jgi:RimJ/RimL family protein N-acetyltransferase
MTPEVQLREVAQSDLPIFFEHQRDPLAVHMAAFTAPNPNDRAAFNAHWGRILAGPSVTIQTIVVDGQVAGSVSSYMGDVGLEVTYWLGRDFWGRGIATTALAKFLTRHQTQRPLYARAAADNAASIRVLEKCGFVLISRERGYANARAAEIDEVLMALS